MKKRLISWLTCSRDCLPAVITIARSDGDEYTARRSQALLQELVGALEALYGHLNVVESAGAGGDVSACKTNALKDMLAGRRKALPSTTWRLGRSPRSRSPFDRIHLHDASSAWHPSMALPLPAAAGAELWLEDDGERVCRQEIATYTRSSFLEVQPPPAGADAYAVEAPRKLLRQR